MKEQFIGVALARVALAYSLNRKSSQSQYYTCTAARCWCSVHLAALALQSDAMKTDENHQVSCQKSGCSIVRERPVLYKKPAASPEQSLLHCAS